ncbi:helix-turn-helix domain-containing protein (plasmid) [Halomicrobium sp. HM KBTZ05]|uniref:helix-turn-helix domain-containing protein n=1 Tax=Halomicrobium sp. HM KBTZ05 TaxID=3242663 RepID=UPI00355707B7
MREFVFTLNYAEGADAVMDVFIDAPEMHSTTLICPMTDSEFWRLDRISGGPESVERAAGLLTGDEYGGFSISDKRCGGDRHSEVLASSAGQATVYTHVVDANSCDSVSLVANRYLPGAVLIEVTRRGPEERWRVLMQTDERIGLLYDTISGKLREEITFRFEHLETVTTPPTDPLASLSLRPEQRRVLELAAEMGYYETPRETTLEAVASRLDEPRSTVSYRLRRAEAELVDAFLSST